MGLIACQWANSIGARLIGTTSSHEKGEVAKKNGAWEVINYLEEDTSQRVRELTQELMVPVVYDGIGKATWDTSLNCLQRRGLMVSFGNASGPVTGVDLSVLAQKGSLFVTRPILGHYVDNFQKLEVAAADLFTLVGNGTLKVDQVKTFSLQEASNAHWQLLERSRVGAMVLVP